MTHPHIAAVARCIVQRRLGREISDSGWVLMLAHHDDFHAEFAKDGKCGTLVCDAMLDARAALRALATLEPTPGMIAAGNDEMYEPVGVIWRYMTAELVKECERDA